MKHLHHAVVLALLFYPTAFARQANPQRRPLELVAKIVSQSYCSGSRDIDFLHLRVRLQYINVGDRKLILYQGHNLFFSVWINPRPEQDTVASYELKTSTARFLTTGSEDVDKFTPPSAFVVLAPGRDHVAEISVSLPVARGAAAEQRSNASIGVGEHLLQIRAATWYESREMGEKLRERWQRRGLLWIDPVGTTPILLSSKRPARVEQCR